MGVIRLISCLTWSLVLFTAHITSDALTGCYWVLRDLTFQIAGNWPCLIGLIVGCCIFSLYHLLSPVLNYWNSKSESQTAEKECSVVVDVKNTWTELELRNFLTQHIGQVEELNWDGQTKSSHVKFCEKIGDKEVQNVEKIAAQSGKPIKLLLVNEKCNKMYICGEFNSGLQSKIDSLIKRNGNMACTILNDDILSIATTSKGYRMNQEIYKLITIVHDFKQQQQQQQQQTQLQRQQQQLPEQEQRQHQHQTQGQLQTPKQGQRLEQPQQPHQRQSQQSQKQQRQEQQPLLSPYKTQEQKPQRQVFHEEIQVDDLTWKYIQRVPPGSIDRLNQQYNVELIAYSKQGVNTVKVSGQSQNSVENAVEAIATKVQSISSEGVTIALYEGNEDFQRLSSKAKNDDLLLEKKGSNVYVIGPKSKVNQFTSTKTRRALSTESNPVKKVDQNAIGRSNTVFTFNLHIGTATNLSIEVARGNLIAESCTAIVNPANTELKHGGGAAKAIAVAAGDELIRECAQIVRNEPRHCLDVGQPVHTTAGNLRPNIKYVIHVAGPYIKLYKNREMVYEKAQETFYNTMRYANDEVQAASIAIPAIGSGIFGLDKERVAHESFSALEKFVKYLSSADPQREHLKRIRFVNVDDETTGIFENVFRDRKNQSKYLKCLSRPRSVDDRPSDNTRDQDRNRSQSSGRIDGKSNDTGNQGRTGYDRSASDHYIGTRNGQSNDRHRRFNGNEDSSSDVEDIDGNEGRRLLGNNLGGSRKSLNSFKDVLFQPVERAKKNILDGIKSSNRASSLEWKQDKGLSLHEKSARSPVRNGGAGAAGIADDCAICLSAITDPRKLDCGHTFCIGCIDEWLNNHQPKCPSCGRMFGAMKGNQPDGTMQVNMDDGIRLAGYEQYGAIVITYNFQDGIQGPEHPNPGLPYGGTRRKAFLPASPEGHKVCDLLKKGFDQRVIFTIGRSVTTGRDNSVVWNDVHHKTSLHGQYGYPDPTYLARVRAELEAKGVTDNVSNGARVKTGNIETSC